MKLLADSIENSPYLNFSVRDEKSKIDVRTNLYGFLKDNEILLLNNKRLTIDMLPKSDYYLFVDWIWLAPAGSFDDFSKLDSLCSANASKITFIKVHASNTSKITFSRKNN